jgi:signal transduction histidine kinase
VFRRLTPQQLTLDLLVSAGMVLVLWAGYASSGLAHVLVIVGMGIALALRRLSPGLALGVAWVVSLAQMAAGLPPNPVNLAIAGILYTTAAYGSKPVRWLGFASAPLGALIAAVYVFLLPRLVGFPWFQTGIGGTADGLLPAFQAWIAGTTFFLLAWTLGLLARTWMRARESRRAQTEAERTVVVEQERNRIARDMHDVVAHSLAVVIAQADGARYAQRTDPAAAEAALTTIAATAREALSDVRVLLARLRHSEGDVPQPALDDLDRLAESFRASGLELVRTESGTPRSLSAAAQLAVYRVVQEALTNALRHGDTGAPVPVHFAWEERDLRVTVRNRLRPGAGQAGPPGHGLTGMTERAALIGGRLEAGPAGDQFVVEVVVPLQAAQADLAVQAEAAR